GHLLSSVVVQCSGPGRSGGLRDSGAVAPSAPAVLRTGSPDRVRATGPTLADVRLGAVDAPDTPAEPALAAGTMAERGMFANRTLNLRSVAAIGYDMDYTLIHYRTEEWEGVAF